MALVMFMYGVFPVKLFDNTNRNESIKMHQISNDVVKF